MIQIHGTLKQLDEHFTKRTTSSQDMIAGDELSAVIGDLFIDFHFESPKEQWTRVAKALRIHGFSFSFGGETK